MLSARAAGIVHCFFIREQPLPSWRSVGVTIGAGAFAFVCLTEFTKTEFVSFLVVPTGSMLPAIEPGDRIAISRYHRSPKRGELVAFRSLRGEEAYVKRVVALGGDTVRITQSRVFVNDNPITLTESAGTCSFGPQCELRKEQLDGNSYRVMLGYEGLAHSDLESVAVTAGTVFVLGDNRDNSYDSRSFGPVPVESIIGRVQFTWLSVKRDGN